jgi:hypothetical protein
MANMLGRLKRCVQKKAKAERRGDGNPRRRDSDYYRVLGREIAKASPERAGELAGHPIERRDT